MKPKLQASEKDFGKGLKAFEQLPVNTKEFLMLEDQTEKSTGQEKIDLEKKARDKSTPKIPPSWPGNTWKR